MALITGSDGDGKPLDTRMKAIQILHDHYLTKPDIKSVLPLLVRFDEPEAQALLHEIIAKNPDRDLQVKAYRSMIAYREMTIKNVSAWKDIPTRVRQIEANVGKAETAKLIAQANRAEKRLPSTKPPCGKNIATSSRRSSSVIPPPRSSARTSTAKPPS